jgi:hypothetical protein
MMLNPLQALADAAERWARGVDGLFHPPAQRSAATLSREAGPFHAPEHFASTETPRVIADRGLGVAEQDAEWLDCDGDLWRHLPEKGYWENAVISQPDFVTGWYQATPSEANAPYTEIPKSSSPGEAPPDALPVEERPAPAPSVDGEAPQRAGAGHPKLTRDDFMDAARAAREKGDGLKHPNFAAHWHQLAGRLETAAVTSPARISVRK